MSKDILILAFWEPNENGSFMEKETFPVGMYEFAVENATARGQLAEAFAIKYRKGVKPEVLVAIDSHEGEARYLKRFEKFFHYEEDDVDENDPNMKAEKFWKEVSQ